MLTFYKTLRLQNLSNILKATKRLPQNFKQKQKTRRKNLIDPSGKKLSGNII
jgi:hypothetical protein